MLSFQVAFLPLRWVSARQHDRTHINAEGAGNFASYLDRRLALQQRQDEALFWHAYRLPHFSYW